MQPADAIEDIFVRDFTTLHWDILRMRRIKAHRLTSSVYGGLESVLRNLVDPVVEMLGDEPSTRRPAQELANKWFKRIPAAIAEVNERMGPANVTMEDVRARAYPML